MSLRFEKKALSVASIRGERGGGDFFLGMNEIKDVIPERRMSSREGRSANTVTDKSNGTTSATNSSMKGTFCTRLRRVSNKAIEIYLPNPTSVRK